MRWSAALFVLIMVGVLVAVVTALGARRKRRSKTSVRVDAPPQRVWAYITNYENEAAWRPDVEEVEMLPDRPEPEARRICLKDGEEVVLSTIAREEPRRIVWRFVETSGAYRGVWDVRIAPDAGGARVTIRQHVDLRGPVARLVALLGRGERSEARLYLGSLATALGDEMTPVE